MTIHDDPAPGTAAAGLRARLGPDAVLVVEQFVALDADLERARDAARRFQRDIEGGYPRHFARTGFDDDDVARLSDRLIDGVVACGDLDRVTARVAEHHTAGADHVALLVVGTEPDASPMPHWRRLAEVVPA